MDEVYDRIGAISDAACISEWMIKTAGRLINEGDK